MHLAVWAGAKDLVRQLVLCGCSPLVKDKAGDSPCSLAQELHDTDLLTALEAPERLDPDSTDLEEILLSVSHNSHRFPSLHRPTQPSLSTVSPAP